MKDGKEKKAPHEILGISKESSIEEIVARYRLLSQEFHPDKYKSKLQKTEAEQNLNEISIAYHELLNDAAKQEMVSESENSKGERGQKQNNLAESATETGLSPAPFFLRVLAFGIDCVFVALLTNLSVQGFFSNEFTAYDEARVRYANRLQELREFHDKDTNANTPSHSLDDSNSTQITANPDKELETAGVSPRQSKKEAMRQLQEQARQDPALNNMLLIVVISVIVLNFSYWFVGERFFKGSSLGKRVFSLNTRTVRGESMPGTGICMLRTFAKVAPLTILELLLQSYLCLVVLCYLIPFFNQHRMAGHDLLCRTMVIRGQRPLKKT